MEAVNRAMERMAAEANGFSNRFVLQSSWPGADNLPITLTWSFVPDGVTISSGVGEPVAASELFAQMDAKFASVGGRAAWIAQFEAVFARWSQLTGITYQRVTSGGNPWDDGASWGAGGSPGERGDVRIGMKPIDGAFGVLAYNGYPSAGDMVLDSAENWASPGNNYRYLRNTVAHEHGHGIGLAHVCPRNSTKLMEPYLATAFDGPQQDEVRAAQRSYGDPYEPNSTTATATPIGTLDPGGVLTPSAVPAPAINNAALTSIAVNSDVDHYRFTVSAPLIVTATATPVGSLYADHVQDASCDDATANTDSRAQADLAIDLLNSAGTALATASAAGFSASETIAGYLLSPGVNYFIKVRETNSPTESQLYSLTIGGAAEPFSASDGAFGDRVRLTWGAIANATNYTIYRGTSPARGGATLLMQMTAGATQFDDTTAVAGTTYFYWLEATTTGTPGSRAAAGPETGLRGALPANDACAGALVIAPGAPVGFNSSPATTDGPAEPSCFSAGSGQVYNDLWYVYIPASSGRFRVQTCGSSFDTRLAVYAGSCPSEPGAPAACNDDSTACGGAGAAPGVSRVSVSGVAGQTYRIRVGAASEGAGGVGEVQVLCPGDFNATGDVSVQDIFDFLGAHFAGDADADVNADGLITVQDIFDFLAAYFGPC